MHAKWMNSKHMLAGVVMVVCLLAFTACSAPATPTINPGALTLQAAAQQTRVAADEAVRLTAQAKLNQTFVPSETPSPEPTRTRAPSETPTHTITAVPTRTNTLPPSHTPTRTPSAYECRLVAQSPRDGSTVKPDTEVTVRWTIRNIGPSTWEHTAIDFYQIGGAKIAKASVVDLPQSVERGEDVEIEIVLVMPDATGSYRTDWKLVIVDTAYAFCPVFIEVWAAQ